MTRPPEQRLLTEANADPVVAEYADTVGSALNTTLTATVANKRIIANHPRYGEPYTRAAVIAALEAAEDLGQGTIVEFPAGVYDVGAGLSLSGYSCQIRGEGAAGSTANPFGTTFYASAQNGPVLDYTGWVKPDGMQGKTVHGGFNVKGSGVADPTKNNAGIRLKSMSSALFHDISVRNTGGPGLEGAESPGDAVYLCDFERIVVTPPVGAKTNDVPSISFNEANGNNFRSVGIRSRLYEGDCGASGAVVIKSNASFASYHNVFSGCWVEFIHVPTDGTIFAVEANRTIFTDTMFFDCLQESGATGTSYFRFTAPGTFNQGGNVVRGIIPGKDTNGVITMQMGIDMRQSNNRVEGVKGYNGANVVLAAGVTGTFVEFGGAESGVTVLGWVDNSGSTTNTLIDHHYGTVIYGAKAAVGNPMHKIAGLHVTPRIGAGTLTTNSTIAYAAANVHDYTLGANISLTSVTGAAAGADLTMIIRQDATGNRTVTWPANFKWEGGAAPVLSTAAGKADLFRLYYDGTNWREISRSIGT